MTKQPSKPQPAAKVPPKGAKTEQEKRRERLEDKQI